MTTGKIALKAEAVLSEFGDKIPADCLMDMAAKNHIYVKKVNRPDLAGTKGGIRKVSDKYTICINTYRGKITTDNFTLAHELGHYFLGHLEKNNSPEEEKRNEREAFEFAYALLMPQRLFYLFFGASQFDFYTLTAISEYFKVSKFVAAARYVQLSSEAIAVVAVENNRLKQFEKSKSFPFRIKSAGSDIFCNESIHRLVFSKKMQTTYREVPAADWLQDKMPKDSKLYALAHFKDTQNALALLKCKL